MDLPQTAAAINSLITGHIECNPAHAPWYLRRIELLENIISLRDKRIAELEAERIELLDRLANFGD